MPLKLSVNLFRTIQVKHLGDGDVSPASCGLRLVSAPRGDTWARFNLNPGHPEIESAGLDRRLEVGDTFMLQRGDDRLLVKLINCQSNKSSVRLSFDGPRVFEVKRTKNAEE